LLAERLQAERDLYWPRVRLPILTKALDYVLAQGEPVESILLFVSDQDRELVGEEEWQKDTCEVGTLVRAKLLEQYAAQQWRAKQVRLHTIPGNPADYDTMLAYFEHELPRILGFYEAQDLRVYLSLTGGTPAMNAMLLVVGNQVFGPQTVNLYDARGRKQPFPLGVGRRLAGRALGVAFRTNLQGYQYAAALRLLEAEGQLLVDSANARRIAIALLTYARDRLAFNFADAGAALDAALPYAAGSEKDRMLHWQNQVIEPEDTDRLRELYFGAEIKRLNHAYAGWLERAIRFQENGLRQSAVGQGVVFRDRNMEYLDREWVDGQPELVAYLEHVPSPGGGRGLDPYRPASRPLLRAVLAFLAKGQEDNGPREFLALSDRLEGLAALRNHWVHRSRGVRQEDLEEAFGGSVEAAAAAMGQMFRLLTGAELGANPYDEINHLCLELIQGG
jgi:hypothetical protein